MFVFRSSTIAMMHGPISIRNLRCLMKQIFRKILKYQSSWNYVHWKLRFSMPTDGHTDRNNEANTRFSRFCERVWKWKGKTN